ncbi:hypothetical protein U5640_43720 [Streptomyces sp. SS7]|uniref:hypothetical protein n=1 Tax=Streptomyces sp. SS7 TaxID=3108485 RepID=UPI0030EC6447
MGDVQSAVGGDDFVGDGADGVYGAVAAAGDVGECAVVGECDGEGLGEAGDRLDDVSGAGAGAGVEDGDGVGVVVGYVQAFAVGERAVVQGRRKPV